MKKPLTKARIEEKEKDKSDSQEFQENKQIINKNNNENELVSAQDEISEEEKSFHNGDRSVDNYNDYSQSDNIEESSDNEEEFVCEENESENTEEELMREYEKIKQMREEEKKKKEIENSEKLQKQAEEQLLMGNPLVNASGYSLKKKWFEDTVFKNQSKNEPKIQKRFVNDTVRSDFHRKFLSKSIQ